MKKISIKAITVLTLILCLSIGLVSCGKKNGSTVIEAPIQGKVPFANLVSDSEKSAVNSFLEKISNAFGKPFEVTKADSNGNKKDLYFTASGVLEIYPDNTDTTFDYVDTTKTVYTKFDFQAIIDQNVTDTVNKNMAMVSVVAGGSRELNKGDEITAVLYYDGTASENVLVSVTQPNTATVVTNNFKINYEKKIKVGNINDLIKALPIGNIASSNPIKDLIQEIDNDGTLNKILPTILGSTLSDFVSQQLTQLFARMLYNGTDALTPAFSDVNDTYSLEINSQNLNNALKSFFARGEKVVKDKTYNPKKDFINNSSKEDVLNNDTDDFFKKFSSTIGTINGFLKVNLSSQLSDWANISISDNALNLKTKFTKTDNGISNGEFSFNLNKNSQITVPNGSTPTTITIPASFSFKLSDFNFAIKEYASSTDAIDQGIYTEKIQALNNLIASNIIDISIVNTSFTAVFKEVNSEGGNLPGTTIKVENPCKVSFIADIDLFSFLKLDKANTEAVNKGFVEAAFNKFELTVKSDNGNNINFNAKWDNAKKAIVVSKFDKVTQEISSASLTKSLLTAKDQISKLKDFSIVNIITGIMPCGGLDLSILTDLNITNTDISIPAGIDNAILKLFGLDYKTLFGLTNDVDIASEIFPSYTTDFGTATKYFKIDSIVINLVK